MLLQILPAALSFTLLGGVESLLSAKVADGMTPGRRHRSNMELVAQGLANIACPLRGDQRHRHDLRAPRPMSAPEPAPLSGMMHSLFLLLFMLIVSCWRGSCRSRPWPAYWWSYAGTWRRRPSSRASLRDPRTAAVLLTTFGLTLVKDLTFGIVAGCLVAAAFAVFQRAVPEEGA